MLGEKEKGEGKQRKRRKGQGKSRWKGRGQLTMEGERVVVEERERETEEREGGGRRGGGGRSSGQQAAAAGMRARGDGEVREGYQNGGPNISSSLHRHYPPLSFLNQNLSPFKTHLQFALCNIRNNATHALLSQFPSSPSSSAKHPSWARISRPNEARIEPGKQSSYAMSNEVIEERLAGVPVYALSNSAEEFVLVSGVKSGKALGLFCFKEEDADALLQQMKLMDPGMRRGSRVVAVALNKVLQLKVNGVAFRLIPEASQVKNALTEKEKAGGSEETFSGIPVFQSQSLILRSQNKTYHPVFFRKEDLENSLSRAARDQNRMNPALRQGDIKVEVLEEIITGMKDASCSKWDDVVFIPPGFDVSTNPSRPQAANR